MANRAGWALGHPVPDDALQRRISLDDNVRATAVKNPVKARGAVKGHNVRYVLAFSLIGVILAFILIAFAFGLL
jgi:hypothetical protein